MTTSGGCGPITCRTGGSEGRRSERPSTLGTQCNEGAEAKDSLRCPVLYGCGPSVAIGSYLVGRSHGKIWFVPSQSQHSVNCSAGLGTCLQGVGATPELVSESGGLVTSGAAATVAPDKRKMKDMRSAGTPSARTPPPLISRRPISPRSALSMILWRHESYESGRILVYSDYFEYYNAHHIGPGFDVLWLLGFFEM